MKYIYIEPSCGAVLEWIDTAELNHVLPESIMEVNDAFWQQKLRNPAGIRQAN
ncbi:hypothetical protein ACUN4K_19170 [Hafnia alvei]|uniref:hypothetical protein n=1 Tax=Hafnia alvei TaxID=569 RepID=UPI000DF8B293|nr:hypothetical protein [Hafnia alvei]STQ73672.1 Uncharacterised protein [Hafnia alvei]